MLALTILVVISFSFAFMTRTQTRATLFFKEGIEGQFLAESGIQRAVMELDFRAYYKNKEATIENSQIIRVDGRPYTVQSGENYYIYSVLDETGKINLNTLTDVSGIILNNLLVNQEVPKEQADIIVDSILDWKDPDDLNRLHGAESDYYMSLPDPYKAKNANFDTVEEVIMVKGMTPRILYGDDKHPGIIDFLTVGSKGDKINVNAAPKEVLAALPGMSADAAQRVIDFREGAELKNIEELRALIGDAMATIAPYAGITESNSFTIKATGFKKERKTGFTVKTIVTLEGNGKYQTSYYKSPAEGGFKGKEAEDDE